jgi:hypothetical protein
VRIITASVPTAYGEIACLLAQQRWVDASPPVAKRHTKRGRLGEMAEFAVLLLPCGGPLYGMRSPNSLGRLGDLSSLALYRPLTRDK